MKNRKHNTELIKAEAKRLGFSDCGISKVETLSSEKEKLERWLDNGFHAEMNYMAQNFEKRLSPALLVPNAQSVISVSLNYFPGSIEYTKDQPKISKYALGRDYHKVMKKMLKQLFAFIQSIEPQLEGRFFVDSAPVMDRVWAEKSGLGWRGKHGLMIHKDKGSFFFIGEIISSIHLEYDKPVNSYCGNCTACIDACPTTAITEPYIVDANRCISYQTIENANAIPENIISNIDHYIFGCDICQDACPWNKKSVLTEIKDFGSRKDLTELTYNDLEALDEESFNTLFNGTPIKRAGYQKIFKTVNQIKDSTENRINNF